MVVGCIDIRDVFFWGGNRILFNTGFGVCDFNAGWFRVPGNWIIVHVAAQGKYFQIDYGPGIKD